MCVCAAPYRSMRQVMTGPAGDGSGRIVVPAEKKPSQGQQKKILRAQEEFALLSGHDQHTIDADQAAIIDDDGGGRHQQQDEEEAEETEGQKLCDIETCVRLFAH
jgi:hypothetical protein|eukprot:COSAG01_NODE_8906_length_2620_cov_2.646965_3_plen_105_part_00